MNGKALGPVGLAPLGLAVLALLLSGCGGDRERNEADEAPPARAPYGAEGLRQLRVDADPALLGLAYDEPALGLRFAPPRGWPPLDHDVIDQTRAALRQIAPEGTRYHGDPVRIFNDQSLRLFMILADWSAWEIARNPVPALAEYRERIRTAMPDVEIEEDAYLLGEIAVYQLLLGNEVMVNRRLILIREGRRPVQVDYLVPRGIYPDVVKGIEASIGSIRPLGE